ncbi:DUF4115 domain-containing protein [Mannheimia sp. AT1]|uniref:DUF4115 domain-containing protein n=1 Tax=Mannheimia cairinae TaxID=3025936 RepID=A0ABT5MN09_9PAST|nr:RodZ domain-containing protein [Mannheimia cairinae]MDD0823555.1 DUF4115 domain-containing protein [Mannheimia cairinae]MDD0826768.1 DUF4115 domain-containing protein [Mannheimia cairinae]
MTESVHSKQEQFHSDENALTLGQKLRSAREALNLSIADVAAKTNLKKSHIESLENDIFILKNVAPTFVRGYVRNYVKFLRLPESLISSVNYGEVTIPKEVTKVSPVNSSSNSQGKSLKYLTVLVLLAALGMTLLWWWQGYQKDQENREQLVSSVTNEVTLPVKSEEIATQQPLQAQVESQVVVNTTPAEAAQAEATSTEQVEPAQPQGLHAIAEESKPELEPAQNEVANILQQPQQTEEIVAEPQTQTEEVVAVENDELRIEITGSQSWITVRGPNNKRLAEKLYNNGEVLTFNGNEQYRLTIGAPANVKLYYKGQEVPLKIDGRVARIRLPLQ